MLSQRAGRDLAGSVQSFVVHREKLTLAETSSDDPTVRATKREEIKDSKINNARRDTKMT